MAGPAIIVINNGDVVTPGPVNANFAALKAFLSNFPFRRIDKHRAIAHLQFDMPEFAVSPGPNVPGTAVGLNCNIVSTAAGVTRTWGYMKLHSAGTLFTTEGLSFAAAIIDVAGTGTTHGKGAFTVKLQKAAAFAGPWTDVYSIALALTGAVAAGQPIGLDGGSLFYIEAATTSNVDIAADSYLRVRVIADDDGAAADQFAVYGFRAMVPYKVDFQA